MTRAGVAGAALTFAPVRYLLKPDPVFAADSKIPCACGNSNDCCNGNSCVCCDGYSEFCVTLINKNECPPGTFIGGYWKVKSYQGTKLCSNVGKRFIYDCHADNADDWHCHCASGECDCRAVAAVRNFRYGQCNKQIKGKTPVICRIVTCKAPWKQDDKRFWTCGKNLHHDKHTRVHEPCHG